MSKHVYEVMVETQFSAAHALRHYRGQGESVHGHNWRIQVFVRGKNSTRTISSLTFGPCGKRPRK